MQDARPPAQPGSPTPKRETWTPIDWADRVRQVLAEDRPSVYPYVTGLAQASVEVAADRLDAGDATGARTELAGLLAAFAVLDEPAADVRRKLAAEKGCDGCREVGPLLVGPGTSGRSWRCETCGTVWSHDGTEVAR